MNAAVVAAFGVISDTNCMRRCRSPLEFDPNLFYDLVQSCSQCLLVNYVFIKSRMISLVINEVSMRETNPVSDASVKLLNNMLTCSVVDALPVSLAINLSGI